MIVAGAIMLVVGAIVSTYLGSVLVHDYTSGNISSLDALLYDDLRKKKLLSSFYLHYVNR
jgi:hypothetical protein